MQLRVSHQTRYHYAQPAAYTVQSLRLTPRDNPSQRVLSWSIETPLAKTLPEFRDGFGNVTHTLALVEPHLETTIRIEGVVETSDTNGVLGAMDEALALPVYLRQTELTRPNAGMRDLAADLAGPAGDNPLDALHQLMGLVRDRIDYETGTTHVETTASGAFELGRGVCQDHAHVFIACARLMGIPARYVSGYLYASDTADETYEAGHAWAEAHVEGLGWVGFDVANRVCPGEFYVRLACGLDYRQAAPIAGLRRGGDDEKLDVSIQVAQSQHQQQA